MTSADTARWIGQPESLTLAFKASADPQSVARTVCGMLNTAGGTVLIGAAGPGALTGAPDADETAEDLDRQLRRQISPSAPWSILVTHVDDTPVIVVDVPTGPRKPYLLDGRVYVRFPTGDRPATAEDINRLIQDRITFEGHWERQPALGVATTDLDAAEIQKTVRQAIEAGRLDPGLAGIPVGDVLRTLNLVLDGRPIQAAVVAFGLHFLPWYPQCSLRAARFRGVTKDEFIDQRKVEGHAFRLLAEAVSFLAAHLPVRGTFPEGSLQRQDRPLYPVLALREALVNALCHRDYSIPGGAVSVAVFDDRLEIASTGTLPPGIRVDDLTRDHFSRPRNPLLADLFYRRGFIDLWGQGTQRIVRLCTEAGCPEPRFEERAGEFIVRFLAPDFSPTLPPGLRLTGRQGRLLALFQAHPVQTLSELRRAVDATLSDSTIRNDLNRLRDLGLIESVGTGRGAFWRLARLSPTG